MASTNVLEDLDLSHEEIKRIETALKDEKFRKMFVEYAEEISNPENRKRYEEEIKMMEEERGMDVQFINPEAGHVLKTIIDGQKTFVNICKNDKIDKPSSEPKVENGMRGLHWQIPHSFSPPREDFDKGKNTCMIYDVVFHPDTYTMSANPRFRKLMEDTALEGIERQFAVKIDMNNVKRPKLKYKGKPVATVLRNRKGDTKNEPKNYAAGDPLENMPYPYSNKTSAELTEDNLRDKEKQSKLKSDKESKTKTNIEKKEKDGFTTPKYSIIHRSNLDLQEYRNAPDAKTSTRPRELVISIELPLCRSAAGVDLDIFETKLVLKSDKPAYHLDMKLPYAVDDENGMAKFDKSKKCLVVTLPVVPGETPKLPSFLDDKEPVNENGVEDQPAPLIEEISSTAEQMPGNSKADLESNLPSVKDNDIQTEAVNEKGIIAKSSVPDKKPMPVAYSLPQYDYNQDNETVTFVYHVRNVQEDSVCKSFPALNEFEIKFVSVGDGGFPMHYSFYTQFDNDCKLAPEHCTVDVSDKNVTFTLLKNSDSRSLWDQFQAGVNKTSTEEKLFLTTDTLQNQLDQLQTEGENMGRRTDDHMPTDIKVTHMNEKKLTLKIGAPKLSFSEEEEDGLTEDDCPSSADIQVIHSKATPNLHGILKPRSMSESSEDPSSSADSPTSPRDSDGNRRSVHFNSHVDKTTYKTCASVSSMKQALKSKRRRNRKREERKDRSTTRRRHNSNGSECSSCDEHDHRHNSESQGEEDVTAEQPQHTDDKAVDDVVIEEDEESEEEETEDVVKNGANDVHKQPGYQIHSQDNKVNIEPESESKGKGSSDEGDAKSEVSGPGSVVESESKVSGKGNKAKGGKGSKIAAEIKSKLAEKKTDTTVDDSDDDDVERTKSESSEESVKIRDENQQKVVDKTRKGGDGKGVDKSAAGESNDLKVSKSSENGIVENGNSKNGSGEATPTGGSDQKSAIRKGGKDNQGGSSGSSEGSIKGEGSEASKKGVTFKEGEKGSVKASESGDNATTSEEENKEPVPPPDTELNWNESNRGDPNNPHRTKCAFNFSNAVMFDLDID